MKIDNNIRAAINCYFDNQNSNSRKLAKELGLGSNATPARWVNGSAKEIRSSHWFELFPLIMDYLPEDTIHRNNDGPYYNPASLSQEQPKPTPLAVHVLNDREEVYSQKFSNLDLAKLVTFLNNPE